MYLVKVLKRKDASSIVAAILVAMIVSQLLLAVTMRWASWLSGQQNGASGYAVPGSGWKGEYLFPVVWAVVQLLTLEVLIRVYTWSAKSLKKK